MKQMLGFLKDNKKESVIAPLFKMLEAFFDLLVPIITADIINNGIGAQDPQYVLRRCLLLVLLGLVGLACSLFAQYLAAKASVEACTALRHALFDKIQSLSFSQTDTLGSGTLITRMTSDVNQLQNGLNLFLRLMLRSPFVVLGALVMSFTINTKAALIFAITIPVLSAVIWLIMHKTIPLYKSVQQRLDKITVITRENLTGVRVVRAFGREDDESARFEAANSDLEKSQLGVGRISALMNPLTYVIINLAIVAILRAGSVEIHLGALTVGGIVALVNYMSQILTELVKLANLIVQITKAVACSQRISAVLSMQPKMAFGSLRPDPSESDIAVEFSHVSLTYEGAGAESLTDITFTIKKGQTIGIIGPTGSGKTSLVSLLPRYYDAAAGSVKVFGRDVWAYDKDSLRRCVSTVMQKTQLFSGTIRSNLTLGNHAASDAQLWQALETAQAAEFVREKPGALDAPVEQDGRNFSGGQKQRLSIARSLISNPSILILDDSASALDFATDAALRKALSELPGELTVIIVSQRANSIRHADQILVLDDGRLAGLGRHEALLESCPVYKDIYDSQFQKAEAV